MDGWGRKISVKYDESYIGQKKNYLTVIGIAYDGKVKKFVCQCDCGKIKNIKPTYWDQETVKSCGCKSKELLSDHFTKWKHSEDVDRLRNVHNGMMSRCYNSNTKNYSNYGGRGIQVCDEWHDRHKFVEWALQNGYKEGLSIDRIDVNGDYSPNNCRWATAKEQTENLRPLASTKRAKYEYKGQKYLLKDLCEMFNTSVPAVKYRMNHMGMTLEQALETPKKQLGRPKK